MAGFSFATAKTKKVKVLATMEARRKALLSAISTEEWRRSDDIAEDSEISSYTARMELRKLVEQGEVEVADFPNPNGGFHSRYRGIETGLLAPLFSSPTIDARPLAQCWGWYTYTRKEQQHGIRK